MAQRNIRTDAQLVAERYFHVMTKRCSYSPCTAQIEVWRTPGGKLMPFDRLTLNAKEAADHQVPLSSINQEFVSCLEPHFGTCKGLAGRNEAKKAGRSQEQEPVGREPGDEEHTAT